MRAAGRATAIALALAVFLSLGATAVSAHTKRLPSSVSITGESRTGEDLWWTGFVNPPNSRCAISRRVRVYKWREGSGPHTLVGKNLTGTSPFMADNQYAVQDPAPGPGGLPQPGVYWATATRKVLVKNNRHKHVCVATRSDAFTR